MARSSTSATLSVIPGGSPEGTADDLVGAVQRYVDAVVAPLREQILVQQAEIEALKSRPEPQPGRDGVGMAGGFIDRSGSLVLTASDGTCRELGVVVGRDGKDGLSFDAFEFDVEQTGERTWRVKWTNAAGKEQVRDLRWDTVLDRGVYRAETAYEKGDMVSFGGSIWIAQRNTIEKPGSGCKDWRLWVKHGRDGRDGKSAYEIAVEKGGFKGSEQDWLKSLKGSPGKDGKGFAT
jgi:hypothetical protein